MDKDMDMVWIWIGANNQRIRTNINCKTRNHLLEMQLTVNKYYWHYHNSY